MIKSSSIVFLFICFDVISFQSSISGNGKGDDGSSANQMKKPIGNSKQSGKRTIDELNQLIHTHNTRSKSVGFDESALYRFDFEFSFSIFFSETVNH